MAPYLKSTMDFVLVVSCIPLPTYCMCNENEVSRALDFSVIT
jgi:hypothetical protein